MDCLLEVRGVSKRFGEVIALENVNFSVNEREIHGLLGENGAGKTTLMNIVSGLQEPDAGEFYLRGDEVTIESSRDAIQIGIGMVHQHFMLVQQHTVIENIILGTRSSRFLLDMDAEVAKLTELSRKTGLSTNPFSKVANLSIGEQQRVEILKTLSRGCSLLILDEPTAVISSLEASQLFSFLRQLVEEGRSVVFITHKLEEILQIADRVSVLREGKLIGTLERRHFEKKLLGSMISGHDQSSTKTDAVIQERNRAAGRLLCVQDLQVSNEIGVVALKKVSFELHTGEILGIAGIPGNGQDELVKGISGLLGIDSGSILYKDLDVTKRAINEIYDMGIVYIPSDRLSVGSVSDFTIADNLILRLYNKQPFSRAYFLKRKRVEEVAQSMIIEYRIACPDVRTKAKYLSGGNLQKLIVARELYGDPKVIIAHEPTRGLDPSSKEFVHHKILEYVAAGKGILLVSTDLEEILGLSHRIAVLNRGEIVDIVSGDWARTKSSELSLMMLGEKRNN